MRLTFLIYILLSILAAIPWSTRTVSYICKIPKSCFNNQYLIINSRQKRKRFKLNGKFQNESRYLKLPYEFKSFIRCMKAAFYRLDQNQIRPDQKFLMWPLIKRLGRAFASKHGAEPLKCSFELLKHPAELLRV